MDNRPAAVKGGKSASRMNPNRVAIIVLNWNRRVESLACLASLKRADLGGARIFFVDNGSRDGSAEAVRGAFPDVEVLTLPENRGYAAGNNAGIRAALDSGAEAVLLLNNDTEVAPDFLRVLLWTFDGEPRAGAVSSAIHRIDRPELLDVAYQDLRLDHRDVVRMRGVNALPGDGYASPGEVDVAIGCSLLMRAEALRDVGLFDESFFAYFEEVDWCIRARKRGWRIFYSPLSRVFHHGSLSTRGLFRATADDPDAPRDPALPNAEPMPWNPVRVYLGARNRIRIVRAHATPRQKLAFLWSNLYELPLELCAIVMHREGWMRLGRWSYPAMLRYYFAERHAGEPRPGLPGRLIRILRDAFVILPADFRRAHRLGRLDEIYANLRGMRDGLLGRPVPLERLGLR